VQTVSPRRLAAAAMVAGTPSVSPALWSLVLLTCIAVPASSSGRLFGGQEHHEDHGGRSIDHERVGAQRDGISQKLLVDNVTTVDSWLNGAKKGSCGHTTAGSLRECRTSGRVSIHLTMQAARSLRSAVRVCLNACAKCERCNYVTVNPEVRDCSWYATCNMDRLLTESHGFLSAPVVTKRHVAALSQLRGRLAPSSAATSRRSGTLAEPQKVILFMHMEKTAGTTVRSWFKQHRWNLTNYCASIPAIRGELIELLRANHKRIFVEHHCGLDW
jgi:hypothetical protein